MNIQNGKEKIFTEKLIKEYSKRGFGSMNKNDFEVLFFNLLMKYGNLNMLSEYDVSIELQIPLTKIKRLYYESDLKYGNFTEVDIKTQFFKILKTSNFSKDKNKIEFVIENKFIRTAISAKLKANGYYSDSSFNSEIIRIQFDAFSSLLEGFYEKDAIKIVEECKGLISESDTSSIISFKTIMNTFLISLSKQTGKNISDVATAYITGGASQIIPLMKSII